MKEQGGLLFTRFIPACAGNRDVTLDPQVRMAVHPRVCGEQATSRLRRIGHFGSSPRVRGTVNDKAEQQPTTRFIPACAGNSLRSTG